MDNWMIDVFVIMAIIGCVTGIFNWIRLDKLEKSAASIESVKKNLDYNLPELWDKITLLENDFDEFIQKHHPELWVKFGIKDWKDRKAYEAVCRKIDIALKVDASDAKAQLWEMRSKMVGLVEEAFAVEKREHEEEKNQAPSFEEKVRKMDQAFGKASEGWTNIKTDSDKDWLKIDPTQLDQDKLRDISPEENVPYMDYLRYVYVKEMMVKKQSTPFEEWIQSNYPRKEANHG